MKVLNLKDVLGTGREVGGEDLGWTSRRLLVKDDGMGFSMHDTLIHPNKALHLHYQHHLEAVYCIEGHAKITDEATGEVHEIKPGTLYALDQHDKHVLEAFVLSRFVCVFNPPVSGREVHNDEGAYPPSEE